MFRHWSWLADTQGLAQKRIDGGLSLKCFLELDTQSLEKVATEIITQVTAERDIERMLGNVAESWEEHKFTFERWTAAAAAASPTARARNNEDTGAPASAAVRANDPTNIVLITIANFRLLNDYLNEDYFILSKALKSPSSQFFVKELMREKDMLSALKHVLSLWKDVQEDCLVLARVLLPSVIQPTARLKMNFDVDFKRYSKLMSEVIKKPVIKHCCLNQSQDLRSALLSFKSIFHQQRLEFAKTTQDKGSGFKILPRLNFLSFHDTLVILGGWRGNEVEFQRAAKNLLGRGVSKICVAGSSGQQVRNGSPEDVGGDDDVVIHGIETQAGDVIELAKKVVLGGVGGDHFPDSQSECGKAHSTQEDHSNGDDANKGMRESYDDGIVKLQPSSASLLDSSTCGRIEVSLSQLIFESQSSVARNLENVLRVSPALVNYTLEDYLANIEQGGNSII